MDPAFCDGVSLRWQADNVYNMTVARKVHQLLKLLTIINEEWLDLTCSASHYLCHMLISSQCQNLLVKSIAELSYVVSVTEDVKTVGTLPVDHETTDIAFGQTTGKQIVTERVQ